MGGGNDPYVLLPFDRSALSVITSLLTARVFAFGSCVAVFAQEKLWTFHGETTVNTHACEGINDNALRA